MNEVTHTSIPKPPVNTELTPGPYFVGEDGGRFTIEVEGNVGRRALAVTAGYAPLNRFNAECWASVWDFIEAARLLLEQYDASGDFTMGGCLTNEPFLRLRAALAKATGASA